MTHEAAARASGYSSSRDGVRQHLDNRLLSRSAYLLFYERVPLPPVLALAAAQAAVAAAVDSAMPSGSSA